MTVAWQKREYYAREWSDVVKLRSRVRLLLAFVGLNHTRLFPLLKCCMFFPLVFQLVLKDANLKYFLPKVMKSGYELTWVYSKIPLSPFVFVLFCFFLLKFGRKMCFSYNLNFFFRRYRDFPCLSLLSHSSIFFSVSLRSYIITFQAIKLLPSTCCVTFLQISPT